MLLLSLLLTALAADVQASPVRALVVTGGHDYDTSFYTLFEGYDDLVWDHAISNERAFSRDIREEYDVLVLYDMTSELSDEGRRNLQAFVESGKGVVVLHHAILDYDDWPWWYQTVVGGRYVAEAGPGLPASSYRHDETMTIRPVGDHPVTEGLEAAEIIDETYKDVWISPDVTPLLVTDNPTSDRTIAWVSPYEKSRVVYLQPGHGTPAHRNPAYRKLVHNAIIWTAGGVD